MARWCKIGVMKRINVEVVITIIVVEEKEVHGDLKTPQCGDAFWTCNFLSKYQTYIEEVKFSEDNNLS